MRRLLLCVGLAVIAGCGDDPKGGAGTGGAGTGGAGAGGAGTGGAGLGGSMSCTRSFTRCVNGREQSQSCDPCASPNSVDCDMPDGHTTCPDGSCVLPGSRCGGAGMGGAGMGGAGGSPVGPGPYAIVYAARMIGIDNRSPATATWDAMGLASYTFSAMEAPTRGTCTVADAGGDSTVAIGRWTGGTTGGRFYMNTTGFPFGPGEGWHWAIGAPAATVPAAAAGSYPLLAATKPTLEPAGSVQPGTTTGSAAVAAMGADFKVGLKLVVMSDAAYTLETAGGTATPATSELGTMMGASSFGGLVTSVQSTGMACRSTTGRACQAFVQGFFMGPNADHLAVAFAINATGNGGEGLHGVALFKR